MSRRILIVGLDGGTFDLIEPWAAEGHLPNLARLMAGGSWGRLRSTLQPTTAPAWVSFLTGANQGRHGLYDFVRRGAGEYSLEVTNASHIALPTLFDLAGQGGRRVAAVNVPYTFPPQPVNGVVIGGPFAPAVTRDLVFPPDFLETLQTVVPDYFVLPDYDPGARDPLSDYASKLIRGIELREQLSLHLMKTEPWDLCAVVFMATDEAQHAFWNCQEAAEGSPEARYRHVIRDAYRRIDGAIGAMLAQVENDGQGRETTVLILSDHGAGPFRWMINLNRWLSEREYLYFREDSMSGLRRLRSVALKRLAQAYRRRVPAGVREAIRSRLGARRFEQVKGNLESILLTSSVDWNRTRAYALGAGGNIFINLEGREPAGVVKQGAEYERLCQEIADGLLALTDPETKQPIVARVYRREEVYDGPFLEQAPDLIIEWKDYAFWGRGRYDSQGQTVFEAQRQLDFSDVPLTGSHRPEGILILNGSGIRPGTRLEGARIFDLAPTILSLMGLPVSDQMNGKVLGAAFVEGAITGVASLDQMDPIAAPDEDFAYTPEEAADISKRLRDLGYL